MSMAIKSQGHVTGPNKGAETDGKTKAIAAAKNLEEYLLAHYTMLRDYAGVNASDDRSQLSLDDIVHYHVYGDYRLSTSQVLGPHHLRVLGAPFTFTADELIRADEVTLREYIEEIENHYNTTETVMSPLLLSRGNQAFRTVPVMRFKTTRYGGDGDPGDPNAPLPNESRENRLSFRLAEEQSFLDNLNGFFGYNSNDDLNSLVKQVKDKTEVAPRMSHWANKQLHGGTQALRFFLPSMGTMLVNGDLTKLAKYVGGRIEYSVEDIVDNLPENRYQFLYQYQHREPQEMQTEYGPICGIATIASGLLENDIETAPRIFYEWARHICSHPDYIMYLEQTMNTDALAPAEQDIITACDGPIAVERQNPYPEANIRVTMPSQIFRAAQLATRRTNMYSAGETFINELLNQGREAVGVGTAVKLTQATQNAFQLLVDDVDVGPDDDQDDELVALREEFDSDEVFYIHNIDAGKYQVSRFYRDAGGEIIFPLNPDRSGQADPVTANWLELGNFRIFDEEANAEMSGEDMREKNIGGKIDNLHKVFMRIVMDVYMTFETYASLMSNFVGFNKFSKFQGKNKDPRLRSPVAGGGSSGGSSKPIGEFLVEQRLEVALGQLATQYANMRGNTQPMEQFYSQDLLGAEVQWLASSISQFSPTLTQGAFPTKGNILVQEMYIPPTGLGEDPDYQLQRVKPEVIFLKLDSALLRDIMIEYTRQQNAFVSATARQAGKKGNKNRKGQGGKNKNKKNDKILPTMWMLVKQQALSIASTDNLKPHIMWNLLLDTVDNYRSELTMQYPLVPEHWATTFTVANLRKDPEIYGETVDDEKQRELLAEYMNFLESTYFNSFTFVARLASAFDMIRINLITDIGTLQKYFVERLHQDSKDKILGRRFFPAYQRLLYIMRSFVDIPGNIRGEYSAMVFDEEARERMRSQMRGPRGSQSGQPVVARITDTSPNLLREGQIVRRPNL